MEFKTSKSGEFFSIPNEKPTEADNSTVKNELTVLELKAFNKPPIIDFGKVPVGNVRKRNLQLVNPYQQEVEVGA